MSVAGVKSVFVDPTFRCDGARLINCSSVTAFSFSANGMREKGNIEIFVSFLIISDFSEEYSTG